MSLKRRLTASAYLLKRLALKGEVQRFAPSGQPELRADVPPEEGAVDGVEAGAVRGWARRLQAPDHAARVDVYWNDDFLGRAVANVAREDLHGLPGFHPSGRHAFVFPLPEEVLRLGGQLRLIVADSGLELAGSPLAFEGRPTRTAADDVREALSKVWYARAKGRGITSLAAIEAAYGRRLAILAERDPDAFDATYPVTRVMTNYSARVHHGRFDGHGPQGYFDLLTAAADHYAPTRAGLPMDRTQVEALVEPTGWIVPGRVRSTMLLDVFAGRIGFGDVSDEAGAAELLTRFVLDVLAAYRLPVDLLPPGALAFLREPSAEPGRSRFEAALARAPLFAAAPPPDASRAVAAAHRLVVEDLRLEPLTLAGAPPAPPPPVRRALQPALAVVTGGYGESGLSVNTRHSLAALKRIGVETHLVTEPLSRLAMMGETVDPAAPPCAVALLHVTPEDAIEAVLRLPVEQVDAHLIGFFMWETETLPLHHRLGVRLVDEVWTATRYCQTVFTPHVAPGAPVRIVGHAVQEPAPAPAGFDARAWAGVGEGDYVFLFHFDAHSWITRKNPTGAVRAFRRAFAGGEEDVRLVLKLRRAEDADMPQWKGWWDEFYDEAARDPRVVIVDGPLDGPSMSALIGAADAYVSLHRSEGFGYGLAEAMLAAKPLIATAYSGNLDFTLPNETLLVPAARRAIRPGEFLYADPTHVWGEPDLDKAAAAFRSLYRDRELGRRLGLAGQARVRRDCSLEALAARYAQHLGRAGAAASGKRVG